RLLAHRDVLAQGGELLRSEAEDAAQAIQGVEAPHAFACVHDAPGEARSYAGKLRDLFDAGAVEVEGTRVRRRGRRRLCLACPLPRSRTRWRGRLDASGRPAGERSGPWRGGDGRRRILTVEAIEALGSVGEAGAPFADTEPSESYGSEEKKQRELGTRGAHRVPAAMAVPLLPE